MIFIYGMVTENSLVIKLDDFAFRAATPFVDVPAGDSLAVIIAGPSSEDETDQVVTTIPVGALANGGSYVVIANGLVAPGDYALKSRWYQHRISIID